VDKDIILYVHTSFTPVLVHVTVAHDICLGMAFTTCFICTEFCGTGVLVDTVSVCYTWPCRIVECKWFQTL
jgi:hypothetical protein